jgi:hypothetical protein
MKIIQIFDDNVNFSIERVGGQKYLENIENLI